MAITGKLQSYAERRAKHPEESKYKAAIASGYSVEAAKQPSRAIESTKGYRELLERYAPKDKVLRKLSKLVDAKKVILSTFKGEIVDKIEVDDNVTQLGAVKLAAELHGMKQEVTTQVNVNILGELLKIGDNEKPAIDAEFTEK